MKTYILGALGLFFLTFIDSGCQRRGDVPQCYLSRDKRKIWSSGIVITIMVLEMEVPDGHSLKDLQQSLPVFLSYAGSFVFIAIYWINHHHVLQVVRKVNVKILWANLNLLFWLSLLPFATAWLGGKGRHNEKLPVILYSSIIFLSGLSYKLLVHTILKSEGKESALGRSLAKDRKGLVTNTLNALAVGLAFVRPLISIILLLLVAFTWIVPDKRLEDAYHLIVKNDKD